MGKFDKECVIPEYELARSILNQRLRKNMTQEQLAQKIGTKQPGIARLESRNYGRASISMLKKIAEALDAQLVIRLEPKE